MFIEQLHNRGLSQFSYYIESGKEAVVIDPSRDISIYLELAASRKAVIRYVFETHVHSDFVSGHHELARATGAEIVFGPGVAAGFNMISGADGDEFRIGKVRFRLLHTPGHTDESACFLLLDESGNPHSIFTGDTLFVEEVGRPDVNLSGKTGAKEMAGKLYDSIQSKLIHLPGYTVLYPGHGAGSVCGKMIGKDSHSTVGAQKQHNYALKTADKNEFIELLSDGLNSPPAYFNHCRELNLQPANPLNDILKYSEKKLNADEVRRCHDENKFLLVDTRPIAEFASGHVPGSVFVGHDHHFELTAALVLAPEDKLILITKPGEAKSIITGLASVGLENVAGIYSDPVSDLSSDDFALNTIPLITAGDFESRFRYNSCQVIDVRSPQEWVPGFVAGSKLISLPDLKNHLHELDPAKQTFLYCLEGYRSMVAASLLKRLGFSNVSSIEGGMKKIRNTTIQIRQLSSIHG